MARKRQPLTQSIWVVTSPSPRKRLHLKLPIVTPNNSIFALNETHHLYFLPFPMVLLISNGKYYFSHFRCDSSLLVKPVAFHKAIDILSLSTFPCVHLDIFQSFAHLHQFLHTCISSAQDHIWSEHFLSSLCFNIC